MENYYRNTDNRYLPINKETISSKRNAPSILKADNSEEDNPFNKANFATGPLIAKQKSPKVINP